MATIRQYSDGEAVVLRDGLPTRIDDLAAAFSEQTLGEYINGVAGLEEISKAVSTDEPWASQDAIALDSQTLASWLNQNVPDPDAQALIKLSVQAVFATEPANLSLLHVAFYLASAGGWKRLTASEGGAQQDRVQGGVGELSNGLAKLAVAAGVNLQLGYAAKDVVTSATAVKILDDQGGWHEAKRAVIALPPTLTGRLNYSPPLPSTRDQLTQRMPAGSVIKFHVIYERPWWRDAGLSGQVLRPPPFGAATSKGRFDLVSGWPKRWLPP